jgi:hypothetical protein
MRLWSRDEGGQALILIAAALAGLLLGIGLALDTGQLFVSRRAAQTAADAAAWAGAAVLYAGGSAAQAQTAAVTDATRNGYTNGGLVTLTTVSPPASGTYAGDAGYIEVTITEQVLTRFLFGASTGRTAVTVRAVGGIARSGTGQAVVVTGDTGSGGNPTFALIGSGTRFTVSGGGTSTNSTSTGAIIMSAGTQITGTFHRITGNASAMVKGLMSPAPTTGVAATPDPFASIAGPSTTGLPLIGGSTISTTVTLSPGVYSSQVTVTTGGVAKLNSGTYVFQAGLQTINSGSLILAGAGGVLIYNTYSNYPAAPAPSPTCGTVSLAGTGQLTLAPRATGSYAGILLFQDRRCATGPSLTVRTGTSLSGTLYVPTPTSGARALLTITAANNVTIASQIIADSILILGGNTLTMNFTPPSVSGARVPALVE